jgi:hypothetical protein
MRKFVWTLGTLGIIGCVMLLFVDNPIFMVGYFGLYLLLVLGSFIYFYDRLQNTRYLQEDISYMYFPTHDLRMIHP